MSKRDSVADGYEFKIGETLKVRSGFKIRASETSLESLYAVDMKEAQDFDLVDTSSAASLISFASLLFAISATSLAF